jgi:hypothetical protein
MKEELANFIRSQVQFSNKNPNLSVSDYNKIYLNYANSIIETFKIQGDQERTGAIQAKTADFEGLKREAQIATKDQLRIPDPIDVQKDLAKGMMDLATTLKGKIETVKHPGSFNKEAFINNISGMQKAAEYIKHANMEELKVEVKRLEQMDNIRQYNQNKAIEKEQRDLARLILPPEWMGHYTAMQERGLKELELENKKLAKSNPGMARKVTNVIRDTEQKAFNERTLALQGVVQQTVNQQPDVKLPSASSMAEKMQQEAVKMQSAIQTAQQNINILSKDTRDDKNKNFISPTAARPK